MVIALALCAQATGWQVNSKAHAQASPAAAESNADAKPAAPQATPAASTATNGTPQEPAKVGEAVDFFAEIQPIFAAYCLKCHGPEKRSGGLRLDATMYAQAGGDSAKPIVGGTLETNELYRRVSSDDRAYRMPKNAPSLSPEQIDRIKRWVEQGAVWPSVGARNAEEPSLFQSLLAWYERLAVRYEKEFDYLRPYGVAFLVMQLALLLVSRTKGAYQKGRAWATGRLGWFGKFCASVSNRELTLAWILSIVVVGIPAMRGHQLKLDAELARLRKIEARSTNTWPQTVFGYPPVPIRPDHPKQLEGTYYRGNCERNQELFNNGNYLTSIFRVRLCDAHDKAVAAGEPLPPGKLYVRMEIERAPGTTDLLFTSDMMASVFLSEQFFDTAGAPFAVEPARLETLEAGHRWVARVPLAAANDAGRIEGLIYVYTGRVEADMARGDAQYAIKYDLKVVDGKLDKESDLWMGSFTNPSISMPERPDKIPYREWFDHRPMPTITGENTKDPKLLGVEEYQKKGLIQPEPPPKE